MSLAFYGSGLNRTGYLSKTPWSEGIASVREGVVTAWCMSLQSEGCLNSLGVKERAKVQRPPLHYNQPFSCPWQCLWNVPLEYSMIRLPTKSSRLYTVLGWDLAAAGGYWKSQVELPRHLRLSVGDMKSGVRLKI